MSAKGEKIVGKSPVFIGQTGGASHDPAKQERFEQYQKGQYHGGLHTKDVRGSSKMSEAARARERMEFEAEHRHNTQSSLAEEVIKKSMFPKREEFQWKPASLLCKRFHLIDPYMGKDIWFSPMRERWYAAEKKPCSSQLNLARMSIRGGNLSTGSFGATTVSLAEEVIKKSMFPKREEFQWRHASLLCKRYDLIDLYMGKPPPPPRFRSKLDSLISMPDYVKAAKEKEKTN
ncbi:hypothetical protein Tco_0005093 [Tanacetum coccineum]